MDSFCKFSSIIFQLLVTIATTAFVHNDDISTDHRSHVHTQNGQPPPTTVSMTMVTGSSSGGSIDTTSMLSSSAGVSVGVGVQLSSTEEQVILDAHNAIRSNVYPSASNMQQLVYSKPLSKTAQGHSHTCDFGPVKTADPHLMGQNLLVMQNIHIHTLTEHDKLPDILKDIVASHWGRQDNAKLQSSIAASSCNKRSNSSCGNYQQVVWHNATKVGCGLSLCTLVQPPSESSDELITSRPDGSSTIAAKSKATRLFFVCKYDINARVYEGQEPYMRGVPCSTCPSQKPLCRNNLCATHPMPTTTHSPEATPSQTNHTPQTQKAEAGSKPEVVNRRSAMQQCRFRFTDRSTAVVRPTPAMESKVSATSTMVEASTSSALPTATPTVTPGGSETGESTPLPTPKESLMVHFVNNSPIIANRNEIRVYVQANMQVDSITCSLTRTGIPPKNCSSGSVVFKDVPTGGTAVRIVARAGNKTSTQRIWLRISDQDGFCYVHLTNDKLEIVGNGRSVKASFGSSGSPTGFTCTLDRRFTFACRSPLLIKGWSDGRHTLKMEAQGCPNSSALTRVIFIG